jgi:hypothetical protein
MRQIVEIVPMESCFALFGDTCSSSGLIERASQQIGTNSMLELNRYVEDSHIYGEPTGRSLGILYSAAASGQPAFYAPYDAK